MKKLISLLLMAAMLLGLSVPGLAADVTLSSWDLQVDGSVVPCEKYNIDGSNYFKLRDLAYALNGTGSQFEVAYDDATGTVTVATGRAYVPVGGEMDASGGDKSATAVVSTQMIMIDGRPVTDVSIYNIGGYNYFKLRDLKDYIGFDVDYDADTLRAIVNSAGAKTELNAEEIFARCTPAVFYVEIYDAGGYVTKTGSGFFLTAGGVAVTNYHVISGAASARAFLTDGSVHDVLGVYRYSAEEDWAILQIQGGGFPTLTVGNQSTAVGGATVYAIGSPLGLQNTLSQGLISNPARMDGGQVYIQTSAAISPGSSGGALVNKYGEVIGVVSATYTEGQNLNLAIPMTTLSYADLGALTPLYQAAATVSGSLYLSEYSVFVGAAETSRAVTAHAEWQDGETVFLKYHIGDTGVLTGGWGEWYDGNNIDLYLYPAGIGTTDVTVWLYTDSEVLLDTKTLTVTVTAEAPDGGPGGALTVDKYDVALGLFGGDYSLIVSAVPDSWDEAHYVSYYIDDTSVVSCRWGDWYDSYYIDLWLTPAGTGRTTITIVYYTESGVTLDTATVSVTVSAG